MKTLTRSLNKRKNAIILQLSSPRSAYTPKTFHKLRVELKKLNALFDIIEFCLPEFKRKRKFKPFKNVFEKAGKVREVQIADNLLHRHFAKKALSKSRQLILQNQKSAEDAYFETVTTKFIDQLKKKFKSIEPYVEKSKKKEVEKYLKKKRKKIKNILHLANIHKDQVHELRKRVKTYSYNRRIVEKRGVNRDIRTTDHLSELLGKWHDLRVTLNYIKATAQENKLQPTESKQLLLVAMKLGAESDLISKDILKAIPYSEFVT